MRTTIRNARFISTRSSYSIHDQSTADRALYKSDHIESTDTNGRSLSVWQIALALFKAGVSDAVMSKTILVCGYGPGISAAVARRFGGTGFAVALVARSADKLEAAAAALRTQGVRAMAFPTDLGEPAGMAPLIGKVRQELGPITVVHWNAYAPTAGDLTTATPADVRRVLDVGVTGLVAAVQATLPDLRAQKDSAVLITGGGFAFYDAAVDAMATQWNAMGLAVAKAAQHKLAGLLAEKLRGDGIYVGEVVVTGLVKGTAFDSGNAQLEPDAIADRFFEIYSARSPASVVFG